MYGPGDFKLTVHVIFHALLTLHFLEIADFGTSVEEYFLTT